MNELSPIDRIPGIIQAAVYEDNPEIAFNEIQKLNKLSEMVEEAKGIFIHEMYKVWEQFTISKRESLQSQAYLYLGWHPHTVDRYITEAAYHNQLPEEIQNKPLRERSPITKMLSQGWEPTEEQWNKFKRTSNSSEVYETIRDVKDEEPRKGSLQNYIDEDGNVYCWYEHKRYDVGYLDINNTDLAVVKAINRIITSAGVIRK